MATTVSRPSRTVTLPAGRWGRAWPVLLALGAVLSMGGAALGTATGREALTAAALAYELAAPPQLHPLDLVGGRPAVESVSLDAGDWKVEAVVYRPDDGRAHGAVVFSMGVKAWAPDDPRLTRLAASLARAGIVVLAVDSPGLRFDQIRPRDIEDLVLGFDYLSRRPYVDPARTGFLGVSVGGSLALVAAADPRISDRVAFVDAVGPYFDVKAFLRAVTLGEAAGWQPDPETARVVRKQVIDAATDGRDRVVLNGIFYYGRDDDRRAEGDLSPRGVAVLELLDGRDPERFDALYAAAGLQANADFNFLSPAASIGRVRAPVRLLHSRRDRHIPYGQSEALLAATGGRLETTLQTFDAFDHVDPRRSARVPGLAADGVRLYTYVFTLLRRLR